MKTRLACHALLTGITLALALSLTACANAPKDSQARADAQGYHEGDYDDFYFYPDVGVYYGINSGLYYYHTYYDWVSTYTLPKTIELDADHRVVIKELPRYRPYKDYRNHRHQYQYSERESHNYDDRTLEQYGSFFNTLDRYPKLDVN